MKATGCGQPLGSRVVLGCPPKSELAKRIFKIAYLPEDAGKMRALLPQQGMRVVPGGKSS